MSYYMLDRYMTKADLPNGVVKFEPWNSRPYIPQIRGYCFGVVEFDHQLTQAETRRYNLTPILTPTESP